MPTMEVELVILSETTQEAVLDVPLTDRAKRGPTTTGNHNDRIVDAL